MIIEYIKLRNFRNITDETIYFNNGIFVINGENGEGKTTLLKAFDLLFSNYTENSLKDEIQWDKDFFYLETSFSHQNKKFKYDITYDGSSIRNLYIDSDYFKNSDAVEELKKYFDPKLIKASTIVMQGEADLVNVKPSERRDLLKKIFNLQFNDELNTLSFEKELKEKELSEVSKKIYYLENKKYNFKEETELPFSITELDIKKLKLDNYKLEKNSQEKILKEYEENREKYNSLLLEKDSLIEDISKIEKNIEEVNKNITKYNDELVNFSNEEILKIEKELNKDFNINLNILIKEKQSLIKKDISLLNDKLNSLKINLNDLDTEFWTNKSNLQILNSNKTNLEQGKCPICLKDFSKKEFNNLITDIDILEKSQKEILESKNKIEDQISYLEKEIEEEKNILITEKELDFKIENETNNIKKEKNRLNELLNITKEKLQKDKLFLESNLSFNKNKLEELELSLVKQKNSLSIKENDIANIKQKIPSRKPLINEDLDNFIDSLTDEIETFNSILIINKQIKEENEKLLIEKNKDEEDLFIFQKDLGRIQFHLNIIEESQKHYKTTLPTFIISNKIKQHQKMVNSFLSQIYPKYQIEFAENKSSLKMLYGPKKADVTNASGFERQIFSMAYKYALSQENDFGILFLDEVDSFASEKNSKLFYETIGNMKNLYNHIIIITQKKATKYILERDFGATVLNVQNGKFF